VTVLLWVTEAIHGVNSSLIALIPIAVLTATKVVDVADVRKLPWEVLWLVAGGFSLGISLDQTGLAAWLIGLIPWDGMGFAVLIALIGLVSVVMANFLSNTVTAALLIPVIASLSQIGVIGDGEQTIMAAVVVGICVSLGMCLPISTPPNAIAMSTGLMKSSQMARVGAQIGLLGLGTVLLFAFFYWTRLF
jgi:sodium-dependent dicarboxylate transporter 2/3/5